MRGSTPLTPTNFLLNTSFLQTPLLKIVKVFGLGARAADTPGGVVKIRKIMLTNKRKYDII
jgi:hypothetical protein